MQIVMESTQQFFRAGPTLVQLFAGLAEDGRQVLVLVAAIMPADPDAPLPPGLVPCDPPPATDPGPEPVKT